MPNVSGLASATALLAQHPRGVNKVPYGRFAWYSVDPTGITLHRNSDDAPLAVVTSVSTLTARASLKRIDTDTVVPVNAFLRPFGAVKSYWRTGEYRWHPLNGTPSAPKSAPAAPKRQPKVAAAPAAAPIPAPVAPIVAPAAPIATGLIGTLKTWRDRYAKQPVAKVATKVYSIVGDVLAPSTDLRILDAMKRGRDKGRPTFALITGPAGTAKTKLAVEWGFVNDLPVVVVDGMSIQTASDWYGATLPTAGGFEWVWSDMARLIMTGQPCLIVIDELNRPENERALNGIMPLMDWKGTASPIGAPHAIRLMPGQCIIATLNEGVEFVGTVEVDAAVRDRFAFGVRMTYTNEVIETRVIRQQVTGIDADMAKRLVRIGSGQRALRDDDEQFPSHNVLSTRVLIDVAHAINDGMDPKEAIWAAARARFWKEDEKALNQLIEAQFGPNAAPVEDEDADLEQMLDASGF